MTIELTFIPALLVILIAAGLGRLLSKGIRQPVILGELILGMILGNLIVLADPEPISDIAEIGVLLLLFSTGLSVDFEEFKRLEVASSIVAVGGVAVPFVFGFLVAIIFGFSVIVALVVGVALVATSVGISASVLTELGMLRTRIGALIMGAAVVDDVIGVIIMSALVGIAVTGALPIMDILLLVAFAILFFIFSLTVGIKLFRKFSEKVHPGREDLLMLGLVIVLLFGLVTKEIGLAAIIGAFVAGLVIGQTHFARRLREHVSLIGGSFFIPIFFVWMGMSFDVNAFTSVGSFVIVLIIVAIIGKLVGCSFGAKVSKFSNRESLATGVAMIARAEVALIIAKLMLDFSEGHPGIIPFDVASSVASAILVMVIVTTLVTPPALWKALKGVRSKNKVGVGKIDKI